MDEDDNVKSGLKGLMVPFSIFLNASMLPTSVSLDIYIFKICSIILVLLYEVWLSRMTVELVLRNFCFH